MLFSMDRKVLPYFMTSLHMFDTDSDDETNNNNDDSESDEDIDDEKDDDDNNTNDGNVHPDVNDEHRRYYSADFRPFSPVLLSTNNNNNKGDNSAPPLPEVCDR
ncbi:conserved hypothetical protein [Trichinella spiralis]|uniref:hypothetical protein n=1 Tax=Trichinella spiralis TaxID=6334 RepID=UPI0001EFD8CD|nr:conserved hypothetical protein [Trichinella spiralis]